MGLEEWFSQKKADERVEKKGKQKYISKNGKKRKNKVKEVIFVNFYPGILTKFFDPNILRGFARYLERDVESLGREGKDYYLVISGILPYVPKKSGEKNLEALRSLLSVNEIFELYPELNDEDRLVKKYLEGKKNGESGPAPLTVYGIADLTGAIITKNFLNFSKGAKYYVYYLWSESDYKNVRTELNYEIQKLRSLKELDERIKKEKKYYEQYKKQYLRRKRYLESRGEEAASDLAKMEEDLKFLKSHIEELEEAKEITQREKKYGRIGFTPEDIEKIKRIVNEITRNKYYGYLRKALGPFGRGARIVPYNVTEFYIGKNRIVVGRNFNEFLSSRPLKTNLKRLEQRYDRIIGSNGLNGNNTGNSGTVDYVVEFGPHYGGFRVLQTRRNSKDVYLVSLPVFGVPLENLLTYGLHRSYRHQSTKLMSEPYASGVLVLNPSTREFTFLPEDFLREYRNSPENQEGNVVKLFISGDYHLGAGDLQKTIEDLKKIGESLEKYGPDILVFTGDLLNGAYPAEVINSYEMASKVQPIVNVSRQLEILNREYLLPHVAKYLSKSDARAILISGNHFNKSVNSLLDEAVTIQLLLYNALAKEGKAKEGKLYAIFGTSEGAGLVTDKKNNLKILGIHRPRGSFYRDIVYNLIDHAVRTGTKPDVAVAGHYHTGGIGYGDGIVAVLSPALYSSESYLTEIGTPQSPKGFITLEIYTKGDAKAFKARFHVID